MEYRLAKISGVPVGPRPVTNMKSWASESKGLGTPALNNLTNMPNKRLPGLQTFCKIGFTYPQRSIPVGITKGPSVRLNKIAFTYDEKNIRLILTIIGVPAEYGNCPMQRKVE